MELQLDFRYEWSALLQVSYHIPRRVTIFCYLNTILFPKNRLVPTKAFYYHQTWQTNSSYLLSRTHCKSPTYCANSGIWDSICAVQLSEMFNVLALKTTPHIKTSFPALHCAFKAPMYMKYEFYTTYISTSNIHLLLVISNVRFKFLVYNNSRTWKCSITDSRLGAHLEPDIIQKYAVPDSGH